MSKLRHKEINPFVAVGVILLFALVVLYYVFCSENTFIIGRTGITPMPTASVVPAIYRNDQFGFSVNTPSNWNGYAVESKKIEHGWAVSLRHPNFEKNKVEVPLEIYTLNQWKTWQDNNFMGYPTAAPVGPMERGRNGKYVIATPPRYNFAFSPGPAEDVVFDEVEAMLESFKAF